MKKPRRQVEVYGAFDYKRFPDGCYAVVDGRRRGPCGHDKKTALARFLKSGFIAPARRGK